MSFDKAVDSAKLDADLTALADAIRSKSGLRQALDFPDGMKNAVLSIEGNGADQNQAYENLTKRSQGIPYIIKDIDSVTVASRAYISSEFLTGVYFLKATSIGDNCFRSCKRLESVTLKNAKQIRTLCFNDCNNLKSVVIQSNAVCKLDSTSAFTKTLIDSGTGNIYVPKQLLKQYQTGTNWVKWASQIRAIEDYPEIMGGLQC